MMTPVDWGEAGVETFPLVLGLLFKIIAGKTFVGGCATPLRKV